MPPTRRQTVLRRRITVFGSITVVLAGLVYVVSTGLAPVPASAAALTEPAVMTQPIAEPAWPGFGDSALGAVGFPGVLASTGDETAVPIASIAKMVTALVVLEAKPLTGDEPGPEITFTDADVDFYYDALAENGSVTPVVAGMVLSEREALQAMLIPSANNYAHSLAVWAYGSVDEYLAVASAWLQAHGLTGTSVVDTSGLSAESMSNPADLVEIGKLVVANPTLASIVSMRTVDLPTIGTVTNTNKLLGEYGVDGIKTGTTDEAGACLLFSADFAVGTETVTLVGVMLGGSTHPDLNQAVATLIESVKPGFQEVTLTEPGTQFGTYTTAWGQTSHAIAADSASVLVWSDTTISADATAREIQLGDEGDTVGAVKFTVGDKTVSVPLVLDRTISDPGPAWRVTHPTELAGGSSN